MPFVIDKSQYKKNLPDLDEVQFDISDLPFVQKKDYQVI